MKSLLTLFMVLITTNLFASEEKFSGKGKTGMNQYLVEVSVTHTEDISKVLCRIIWDKGMDLKVEGKGKLQNNVLRFSYVDANGNTGTGRIAPLKEGEKTSHIIHFELGNVVEPRAARQLFSYPINYIGR